MKKRVVIFLILTLIASICIITSCATRITPLKTDNVEVSEEFAVIHTKDYDLAVRYKKWNQSPKNINSYFTTFFVILRNKSNKKMDLDIDSFNLIDSRNEQYNPYSATEVIDIIYPNKDYFEEIYPIIPRSPNEILDIEDQFQNRDTAIKNIQFDSFDFNYLLPNTNKRGYLFFEKIESDKKTNIKFIYKDRTIIFWVE